MEEHGKRALLGELSWRAAAILAGANNPRSLQNHMQTHYDAKAVEGNNKDWMAAAREEVLTAYRYQYEAALDADEKARIWLKLKELDSPNIRPDVLIRIWKEERELNTQKGMAAALTMFGRQMFALPAPPVMIAIESEVVDDNPSEGS